MEALTLGRTHVCAPLRMIRAWATARRILTAASLVLMLSAPPIPSATAAVYDFDSQDHGLFTYVDGSGYTHGVFPIEPCVLGDGSTVAFDFRPKRCQVPGVWGANEIIGVTSADNSYVSGLLVSYDDNDCCRIQFWNNGSAGAAFPGQSGHTYGVQIDYAAATAALTIREGQQIVFQDTLAHTPGAVERMQVMVDYPGGYTDYCHWDALGGTAAWRIDRGELGLYYLEGWLDNVVTPNPEVPPSPPVCFDFNQQGHGLYSVVDQNGYKHGLFPVPAHTIAEGEELDFLFTPTACAVPGFSGANEIIGLTSATFSYNLGLMVSYDDNHCCQIQLWSNAGAGAAFQGVTGHTYRVNIRYASGNAVLRLMEGTTPVFSDTRPHTPGVFDHFQVAVDYPGGGTDFCRWNPDPGRVDWRVDRGASYFLEGWIDDVHTPGCVELPPPPVVCYDFNTQDHGLHTYADDYGYRHGVFPVTPATMTDGQSLQFDFHVSDCQVPGPWGANEVIGLMSEEDPSLLGLLVSYDDAECYRVQLCSNGVLGDSFHAAAGTTYHVVIEYAGGNATLRLFNGPVPVFSDALPHAPEQAGQMQVMVDYPGGGTELCSWNALDGRVDWRVDRGADYHLAGWIDNVGTPGCERPSYVCYDFDRCNHGMQCKPDQGGYEHCTFPVMPNMISDGDTFEFTFAVSDCAVPGYYGANEIIGLSSSDWSYNLGLMVTYDDTQCCQLQLCSNYVYGQVFSASLGVPYRVVIRYQQGTATLTMRQGSEEVFTDALPHAPGIADIVQISVDYPGGGTNYCRWENGRAEWRIDRNGGYHLEGWCDDFITPGCWGRTSDASPSDNAGFDPITLGIRPNPARDNAQFLVQARIPGHARLEVFDASGRLLRRVHDGTLPSGESRLIWDLRDATGTEVDSGICFARLSMGGRAVSHSLVILR